MSMYVCPECGYTTLKSNVVAGTENVRVRWGCPHCLAARHNVVWLVETPDRLVA